MIEIAPHSNLSGSAFGAVAHGVAEGLGRLFPPVHAPADRERGDERAGTGEGDLAIAPDQAGA